MMDLEAWEIMWIKFLPNRPRERAFEEVRREFGNIRRRYFEDHPGRDTPEGRKIIDGLIAKRKGEMFAEIMARYK